MAPTDLLADLPDPRDDEPASLRSDIAEELTDHLVCSVRREMVKGADEPTARERALKRFGDPRQIARKLWWLAMRRRIMNQRLMLGLQAAMLVAIIVIAVGIFQTTTAQQRQMAQQQELLSAALAKLSERLDVAVPEPVTVPDATLTVEFRYANPEESRRGGEFSEYRVEVRGVHISNETIKAMRFCDPKTGVAEFGTLPPGGYDLHVIAQSGMLKARRRIEVGRGDQHREVFNEPPLRVQDETVSLDIEIPADFQSTLNEQHLAVLLQLTPEPVRFDDQDWDLEQPLGLIWTPGKTLEWLTRNFSVDGLYREVARKNFLDRILSDGLRGPEESGFKPHEFSRRKGARYRLTKLGVIADPSRRRISQPNGGGFIIRPNRSLIAVVIDSNSPDWPAELNAVFVAEADKPWRVTVPPALIEAARAQLAELAAQPRPNESIATAVPPVPASPDPKHNRVQVRVVEGTEDGPVIKTARVTLAQPAWPKPLSPAAGKDGSLDFGYLDAGLYTLTTRLTWWGLEESHQFVVHPGQDHIETVVAPPPPHRGFDVKVVIPLNATLRAAKAAVAFYPKLERCAKPFDRWVPHGATLLSPEDDAPEDLKFYGGFFDQWEGDSLTTTLRMCPGTYNSHTDNVRIFQPLDEPNRVRILAPRTEPDFQAARLVRTDPPFTVKELDQEWQIKLPKDLIGEAIDSLKAEGPVNK